MHRIQDAGLTDVRFCVRLGYDFDFSYESQV